MLSKGKLEFSYRNNNWNGINHLRRIMFWLEIISADTSVLLH